MTAMYQNYFGLAEPPFSIAPDPRYLYMSQRHQEALAHLLYGLRGNGGFVLLTGEVGAGKTTVCRCLLEQIPEACDVAYIFNPKLTAEELLSTICAEFGIYLPAGNMSIKLYIVCINAYLLDAHARGRNTVLIIDEAQNLSAEVLEQMRLLTNLETNERKLLQIILIGQPELATMLERPELRQLSQRIVARYHLGALTKAEVAAYVTHRLDVSGARRQLFPASVIGRLYQLSGGIPRVINVLCDRALLGAFVQGKERVHSSTLVQAAREIFHKPTKQYRALPRQLLGILLLAAGGAVAMAVYRPDGLATPVFSGQKLISAEVLPHVSVVPIAKKQMPDNVSNPTVSLPETLEWPAGLPRTQSRALAFAALMRAWGADEAAPNPCSQIDRHDLRCRFARSGLDELRQLNRPAILQLHDRQGEEFYATLTAIDSRSASFSIGSETTVVALGALASQWSGYYTLLWRAPLEVRDNLQPGERGPAVDWLAKQLSTGDRKTADTSKNAAFDESLVRQLKQYQLVEGLVPDGALGPQTLMRLSGVGDQTAPKLNPTREVR